MSMTQGDSAYRLPGVTLWLLVGLVLLGSGLFLLGALRGDPQTWAHVLLASYYLAGLGLGGAVLVALLYVTGAGWAVALRRVPEAMTALLPLAALGLGLVLLAHPALYPWSNPAQDGVSLSPFQRVWLTRPFFLLRSLAYLVLWIALAFALVRVSRRQDQTGATSLTARNVRLSALFLVVFAVTCWLASTDWIMSLEPQWSSTIFGVYSFAGIFLSALAAVTLVVVGLYWQGPFRNVLTRKHLHDLGTLLFGFSSFWMYIWFCQYLLIWYVNNPEETVYFWRRQQPGWQTLFLLNVVLNWGLPFAVLLFRRAKQTPWVLLTVAACILVGRWLDLYLMIMRPAAEAAPLPGIWGAGLFAAAAGLAALLIGRALGRAPLMPIKDPFLAESLASDS
jgi:hypothetical protein